MISAKTDIPSHIPESLVVDFDYHHIPGSEEDYHLAVKRLHDGPDIFWTPRNGGHWVFTRGEDLTKGFADYEHFSSDTVVVPRVEKPFRGLPIETDPPEHSIYRRLIQPAFLPRAVVQREEEVRKLTVALIEGFYPLGGCDFVTEFAQHLPITVFLNMMGLPLEDRLKLMQWTGQFLDPSDDEVRDTASANLSAYVAEKVAQRQTTPGDDLLSKIVHGEIDGRPLREDEMLGMGILMLFGGLDTVVSMLSFFANFLARNPGHRRQLVDDPGLIPNALEEMLRRFGLANPGRVVKKDMEYKGIQFRAGEQILLVSALHGLDEREFDNPLDVDFQRKNALQHSTFGGGHHRCIGSNLARTELRVFLEEWLKRIPEFQIRPGDTVKMASGVNGRVAHLPLAWNV